MGANAQTSVPTFTAGDVLTAANMNISAGTGVPVFATTTTRDAAFGGTGEKTLAEGQTCYIEAAPKRLQVYNGTAWIDFDVEWQNYTPTFTNLTQGNGTLVAQYARIGQTIVGGIKFTLGSTSSVTGRILASVPFAIANDYLGTFTGYYVDLNNAVYSAMIQPLSSDLYFDVMNSAGTYVRDTSTSSTIPFSWGNTDFFGVSFIYRTTA